MFVIKVFTILFLAMLAEGTTDLDRALSIMACAQRAIKNGVPDLDIPSHSPVNLKSNFTWSGDIGVATASLLFHNLSWAGLPEWKVSGTQLSDDSDDYAVFNFSIYWTNLSLYGGLDANFTEFFLEQQLSGSIKTQLEETTWAGTINVTKHGVGLTEEVNDFTISWKTDDVNTTTEDLAALGVALESLIDLGLSAALGTDDFSATMSTFLKNRLNTVWWSTGKIWKLVEWCEANPVTETSF